MSKRKGRGRAKRKAIEEALLEKMAAPAAVEPDPPRDDDPPPGELPDKDDFYDLMGHVRDIRVEAQNLQRMLDDLKKMAKIEDARTRERETAKLLGEWKELYVRNASQICVHFAAIKAIFERNSGYYDSCGDELTCMDNAWDRVTAAWPALKNSAARVTAPDIPRVEEALREIIFHAGYVTIPSRANQHLEKKWVGQQLDFHATFADEMPAKEERQEILKRLHENPMAVNGIVDPGNGMIYRFAEKGWRRVASYVLMALAFAGCGALAVLFAKAGDWYGIQGYPLSGLRLKALIFNYLAIMLGGLFHLAFTALKQYRASQEGAFVALDNWFLWGHVKEKPIIGGIFMIWVVYLGWLIAHGSQDAVALFFVGYSFDSFIDLFLKRFEVAAAKKKETLEKSVTKEEK